ncbi:Helix-loop-helix DNA-binding domain protein [Teladorsagia circumcincta]|uniref:Helix-loop-helix DNA-binding domain protein n=1 Tax=Teladorsagia circumcincta TaxID=45464 RepID=A0A2G9TV06_TELCI|nr:Helix-loop-helix DNA-binding domain protein [Teladorsagia circumcincta]
MESPAYPPPFPCSQGQYETEQSVRREKRKYRCRKRSPATIERARMIRRDKANARERRRMNSLNDALEHLRTLLPAEPEEPKMTKIETLRVAQGYITYLASILSSSDGGYHPTAENTPYVSPAYPNVWQEKFQQ